MVAYDVPYSSRKLWQEQEFEVLEIGYTFTVWHVEKIDTKSTMREFWAGSRAELPEMH